MRLYNSVSKAVSLIAVWSAISGFTYLASAQQAAKPSLAFEAASVRENQDARSGPTNVPLDTEDAFIPTNGLFSAKGFPLSAYIAFAYKQQNNPALRNQLPKWAQTARYDIDARGAGNPTKDEYREMVRTMLAQRFKLQAHMENKKIPVYAMVLIKPETPGPQLRPHSAGAECSGGPTITNMGTITSRPPQGANLLKPTTLVGTFPSFCGGFVGGVPVDPENMPGYFMAGGRGMSMDLLADVFTQRGPSNNLGDKPILDRTGLKGTWDFIVEWTSPAQNFASPDRMGPTMESALKDQLGLKLEPTEAPVDLLLIDHVEMPTAN